MRKVWIIVSPCTSFGNYVAEYWTGYGWAKGISSVKKYIDEESAIISLRNDVRTSKGQVFEVKPIYVQN